MKNTITLLLLLFTFSSLRSQSPDKQWTWVKGDAQLPQYPVFGTKGVANVSNKPGGRNGAVKWTDATGNLWVFGGSGYAGGSGLLNDLWKFSPVTGQWAWMSGDSLAGQATIYGTRGVPHAANKPGARQYAVAWTDLSGNLWLFGGSGVASGTSGPLNDLWMYNPSTALWTWISGDNTPFNASVYGTKGTPTATNKPGGRYNATSWSDASGNFWFLGGMGLNGGGYSSINDLWKYTPSTGMWTWVSGDNTFGQPGVYGTLGTASATNKPGARYNATSWIDASGNLFLFGGFGTPNTIYASGPLNDFWKFSPSSGLWTWIGGDNATTSQPGVYGTKGVASAANKPGARTNAGSWTDASGNFWMFGGNGHNATSSGYLSDLWKYAPSSGQWTWMAGDNITLNQAGVYGTKGVTDASAKPGGRSYPLSWADASGNLWLFGGLGFTSTGSGYLNDVWKYAISSGQWTWMGGDNIFNYSGIYGTQGVAASANKPGSRQTAGTSTDLNGNLWLFGGSGYPSAGSSTPLNDLWKYTPATFQWTWVGGDSIGSQLGVYGTMGTAAAANKPGGRSGSVTWMDAAGNFWVFGGYGYSSGSYGNLNDLWMFSSSTKQWTWMSGDNTSNQAGNYGTLGVAAPTNKPTGRSYSMGWKDASGNFWLFGGNASTGNLSDLWKYSVATGQWTWMAGNNTVNQMGIYGTQGTPAAANKPGSRYMSTTWTDASGNFWMFGGSGYASAGALSSLNDLWKYNVATGQWAWMSGDLTTAQTGIYGTQGSPAASNKPGSRSGAVGASDAAGNLLLYGGNGLAATSTNGYLGDLWSYSIATGQWTWLSGDDIVNQTGIFGTQGVGAAGNKPGAKQYAAGWGDASGNMWLFGGNGYSGGGLANTNDLWKYSPTVTLPVVLSNFTASRQQQVVLLAWKTAQEQNSLEFIVERSSDGITYDNIGIVSARGNTSVATSYSFTDAAPLQGVNHYRLKQVDRDGKWIYSAVAKVLVNDGATHLTVVRNPVQNSLHLSIQLPAVQKMTLQIRDINGRLLLNEIRQGNKGTGVYNMQVSQLSKGTYLVNLQTDNFKITKKFIKQ